MAEFVILKSCQCQQVIKIFPSLKNEDKLVTNNITSGNLESKRLENFNSNLSNSHHDEENINQNCSKCKCPSERSFHTLLISSALNEQVKQGFNMEGIFLLGGKNDTNLLNSFHFYSIEEDSWKELNHFPFGIYGHSSAIVNIELLEKEDQNDNIDSLKSQEDYIYQANIENSVDATQNMQIKNTHLPTIIVFGGKRIQDSLSNELWMFQNFQWHLLQTQNEVQTDHLNNLTNDKFNNSIPSPRAFHTLVYFSMPYPSTVNSVFLFGGQTISGPSNELWIFNLNTFKWTLQNSLSKEKPSPRFEHSMVRWKNLIFVIGGTNGVSRFNDCWMYNISSNFWTNIPLIFSIQDTSNNEKFGNQNKMDATKFLSRNKSDHLMNSGNSILTCVHSNYLLLWIGSEIYSLDLTFLDEDPSNIPQLNSIQSLYKRKNSIPISERIGSAFVSLHDSVYIFGGENAHKYYSDLLILPLSNSISSHKSQEINNFRQLKSENANSFSNRRNQFRAPLISLNSFPNFRSFDNFDQDLKDKSRNNRNNFNSKSFLVRTLTHNIWSQLREKFTPRYNFGLDTVIHAGVQYQNTPVGILSPDEEAYSTFQYLFDPIIISLQGTHSRTKLFDHSFDTIHISNFDPNFVNNVKIIVRRNLKNLPFASMVTSQQRKQILEFIEDSIRAASKKASIWNGSIFYLGKSNTTFVNEIEKNISFNVDDEFLKVGRVFRDWPKDRAIFINENENLNVFINYDDMIQIVFNHAGSNLQSCYDRLKESIQYLDLDFSEDKNLGFLTLRPEHIGTGLTIEVNITIPAEYFNRKSSLDAFQILIQKWGKEHMKTIEIIKIGIGRYKFLNRITYGTASRILLDFAQNIHQFIEKLKSIERVNTVTQLSPNAPFEQEQQFDGLKPKVVVYQESKKNENFINQNTIIYPNVMNTTVSDLSTEILVNQSPQHSIPPSSQSSLQASSPILELSVEVLKLSDQSNLLENQLSKNNLHSNATSVKIEKTQIVQKENSQAIANDNSQIPRSLSSFKVISLEKLQERDQEFIDTFIDPDSPKLEHFQQEIQEIQNNVTLQQEYTSSVHPNSHKSTKLSSKIISDTNKDIIPSSNLQLRLNRVSQYKNRMSGNDLLPLYYLACLKHHVSPNSYIIQQIKNDKICIEGVMNISNNILGDQGCKPLIELIPYLSSIQIINLRHNGLENSATEFICQTLMQNKQLNLIGIDFSKNLISLHGALAILALVKEMTSIEWISIEDTFISPIHTEMIQYILKNRTN